MKTQAEKILEKDHKEIDGLLDNVNQAVLDDDLSVIYTRLDYFWARLAIHIRAEHLRLFPAILKASESAPKIRRMTKQLRVDHDYFMVTLGNIMKFFYAASPEDVTEVLRVVRFGLPDLTKRLNDHNKLEEGKLYPLVSMLSTAEKGKLEDEIERELRNLPNRFKLYTSERAREERSESF